MTGCCMEGQIAGVISAFSYLLIVKSLMSLSCKLLSNGQNFTGWKEVLPLDKQVVRLTVAHGILIHIDPVFRSNVLVHLFCAVVNLSNAQLA